MSQRRGAVGWATSVSVFTPLIDAVMASLPYARAKSAKLLKLYFDTCCEEKFSFIVGC